MSILYKSTRFADTFTGNKETNVRVQLLSWDTLDTKAFVEYLADKNNLSKGDAYKNLTMVLEGIEAVLKKRKHPQSGRLRQFLTERQFLQGQTTRRKSSGGIHRNKECCIQS